MTSSPTKTPPLSSAAFQVRPKSLRLIFVVADTATRVLPQGSLAGGVGPSAVKTTLRVTSRTVRSPSMDSSPSRTTLIREDLKDIEGTSLRRNSRALQVRVSLGIACFQGCCFDQGLDAGIGQVRFVQGQRPRDFGEMPLYVRDHHMLHFELGGGISRVDVPGGGCGVGEVAVVFMGCFLSLLLMR